MKWLIPIFVIMFFIGGVAYADSPSIDDVKVFQDYIEEDDWLIAVIYNISGTNVSTSLCFVYGFTWQIQLIDTVTAEVLTDQTLKQCGMRPYGIYINASQAFGYTFGGNYTVRIIANWGTPPSATYLIQDEDWRGDIYFGEFENWVIEQAYIIEDFDSGDYLDIVPEYDEVLTVSGAAIFNKGISKLQDYFPDLFAVTIEGLPIEYEDNTDDTSYADDMYNNTEVMIGSTIYDAAEAVGDRWLGVDGRMMLAILTILGFLSIAVIEKSVAFLIILGGVLVGFFPMGTVLLLVFLLMVTLVRALFWSST